MRQWFKNKLAVPSVVLLALVFAAGTQNAAGKEDYRVWTSGQFQVEARMAGATKNKVMLERRDGETVVVDIHRLSASDRDYIAAVLQKEASPPEADKEPEILDKKTVLERLDTAIAGERDLSIRQFLEHMQKFVERGTSTRLHFQGSTVRVTAVPPEIGLCTDVTELSLIGQGMKTLPPEIGNMFNLKHLGLNNTQIESLPPEIGQLKNLEYLFLDGSKITRLPPEIGKLTSLKSIALKDTPITGLPREIRNLTGMTNLDLKNTPITDATLELLAPMKNLVVLNVSGTKVTREGIEAFRKAVPNRGIICDFP